ADVSSLVGNETLVDSIELTKYVSDDVGMPTLRDIVAELKKPGRDPRAAFEPPAFREDIQKPSDLLPGMVLEGVVTNIVAFGAFVDIGVHQDGLVHVSQLADRYIKDPNDAVKVGQKVKVTVQSIDLVRGRIALSMRSDGGTGVRPQGGDRAAQAEGGTRRDVTSNTRGPARPAPTGKPAPKPFVPTKGAVAPNGIRFK
ncbi:MAG: S1 RNA-binding domain-containing protein, partial [Gemmatimonadota bacterium]|nr:S1 RNA-binding domain-containing protein [Gemmatimonadota bacterium]